MPARTVVIEKLTKFNGERHESLSPGEYTQLTGRAGRRGIDPIGHAVVLWNPFVTFEDVAELAASRSFSLRSAFRPTYNMAANLVRRYDEEDATQLLNRSFAQYQADRSVVRLEQRLQERRADGRRPARGLAGAGRAAGRVPGAAAGGGGRPAPPTRRRGGRSRRRWPACRRARSSVSTHQRGAGGGGLTSASGGAGECGSRP